MGRVIPVTTLLLVKRMSADLKYFKYDNFVSWFPKNKYF